MVVAVVVLASLMAAGASAHDGPAPGPIFDAGPCILAIDRDAQPSLSIGYSLEADYVQLTQGDIPLPDALTHQFFAFDGTTFVRGFAPELHGFDSSQAAGSVLPLWITQGDVERADHSSQSSGLFYDLSPARAESAVLETNPAFQDRYRRITADDARVSITLEQSLQGVHWDVSMMPTGVYTVAAYIFSPPYNGWEIRPGLVKISSAEHNPPAAVVNRIQEALFPGQGRRIGLCVDAEPGTRLRTYARLETEGDVTWQAWGDEASVETGTIERCFHPPDPAWVGAVRIRADLIDADGVTRSFYSPDVLTQLPGKSACAASESICCEPQPAASEPDAGCDAADASCSQRSAVSGASVEDEPASGCAVRAGKRAHSVPGALALLWLALLCGLTLRRRR